MKFFYLVLFSFLFIPFISFSQEKGEFKEDVRGREEYLKSREVNLSPLEREEALRQKESMLKDRSTLSKTSTTDWVSLEPNGSHFVTSVGGYITGRLENSAFDPTDPNIIYVGAHNGGAWKTTDGGINWVPLTDQLSSLKTGSVVVDQRNPNTVYYSCTGGGLYKSTNAGSSWTNIGSVGTMGNGAMEIAIDPVNSNILYWGGSSGVLKSTNGGTNWATMTTGSVTSLFINPTASIGITVGHNGKIRRTTDGGTTWTAQSSGTTDSLYGVYFVDASIGKAVGKNGRIIRTTNGGSSWANQTSGTTNWLRSVYFYNANKGWVAGHNGTILYTTNSGSNWTAQTSGTTNILTGVSFSDSITGTVVGTFGTILRTTNGGTNWTAQTSGTTNSLNSVAFTDANNGTAVGSGGTILRTIDGGTNWISQTSGTIYPLNSVSFYGSKIGKIVGSAGTILYTTNGGNNWTAQTSGTIEMLTGVSFTDPSRGSAVGNTGTILRTIDGGTTWAPQTSGETIQFNAVNFVYNDTKIIIAAFETINSLIKKSTNAGTSWTTIDKGISSSNRGLIKLAPYKQNSNIIYASIAKTASSGGQLLGLYKSTDFGSNWNLQNSTTNYMSIQGWWNNAIIVKNTDPNFVFAGGVFPWKSTDGGVTLTQCGDGMMDTSGGYIHPDIHGFVLIGNTLYCCNDGGIYKTTNDGLRWTDLNRTLSTVEYYGGDFVIADNNNKIEGGTQDNGHILTTNGGVSWNSNQHSDQGDVCFDQVDTNYVYQSFAGWLLRSSTITQENGTYIGPSGSTSPGGYDLPIKLAPGDNNTLFFGKVSLWKTSNAKTCTPTSGWTRIDSAGGSVRGIGISHSNTSKFYYSNGGVIKATTNNGSTWTTANFSAYDITVDNTDDNVAYFCSGGTNKVGKTTNGGVTWTIINGNLPTATYNSIVLKTSPTRMLFVGGTLGVFQSTDEGNTWVSFNSGFPSVTVNNLKYYPSYNKLMAVTYGRGMWMFDLSGLGKDVFGEIPVQYNLSENFPNPFNPQTHIQFEIPVPGNVKLTIFDVTGREVETLINNRMNAGKFEVTFDGSKYSSGVYLYKLESGSFVTVKKMMLLK